MYARLQPIHGLIWIDLADKEEDGVNPACKELARRASLSIDFVTCRFDALWLWKLYLERPRDLEEYLTNRARVCDLIN